MYAQRSNAKRSAATRSARTFRLHPHLDVGYHVANRLLLPEATK